MRIFLKKKKWMAWVVMLVFLFVSIMPTAALAKPGNGNGNGNNKGDSSITVTVPTTDIAVEKIWNDKNNEAGKRPDEITVKLLKNTVETGKKLTLNAANDWKDDFKDVPVYDGNGKRIEYTVAEDVPEGYTSVVTQPVVNGIESKVALQKVPQSIKEPYSVTDANIIVIKAANKDSSKKDEKDSFYIWTKNSLSQNEQTMLIWGLNHNNPDLEGKGDGKGNSFTAQNTLFITGETSTVQTNKGSDTVTVKDKKISFGNPEVWAMFWYGSIELVGAQKAVITNTYNPAVPEPTAETGSIKIQKNTVLKGEGNKEAALPVTQSYQFTITPQEGITLPATLEIKNNIADAKVTVENNVATVTVPLNDETDKTVEISGLPAGSYVVNETEKSKADLSAEYKFDNVSAINQEVTVSKEPVADVSFKNVYQKVEAGGNTEAKTGEFSFVKVDEADTSKTLAGAEFTLYSDENCSYPETAVVATVVTSDSNGVVKFTGLKLGDNGEATYYLKETKAPVGYELPIDKIYTIKFIDNKVNESWTTSNGLGYIVTNKEIYKPELRTGVNVAKLVEFKPNSDDDYTDEGIRKEIDATEFKFHVNLAVLAVTSSSALDYEFANFATFEEAKIAASELRNDAAVEEFSVTDVGKTVTLDENNTAEFEINVKDEATLNFGVNARLSTGSAIIWMQIAEDMDTATGIGLGWENAYDDLDLTTAVNGESGHSVFGQITSGSVYKFVFTNTYTNTATTPEEVSPWTPLVPSTPVEGGGDTGNENTGGNTGNEESNNDTDNTTTIVDEPTPLVNVPEEPMEELLEEPIEEIEIDEPEVPLTEAPGEPVAIEEPEVPLGDAPKTGDSSNAVLFVALMLAAGAGLVVTRRKFN